MPKTITFEVVDYRNQFWIEFEVPFSFRTYARVLALPTSRQIRLRK